MSGFSLYQRIIQPLEEQMIRSIWRIVRNADDADDVLQDALAVIWKRLDRISISSKSNSVDFADLYRCGIRLSPAETSP